MKTGLVLEGGAMRGLFSAGILDVLMENRISVDGIAGVSAGAAFGCNFKSRQPGRALRYNLRFCRDRRYCSWYSLLATGDLFGAEFCYHELPEKLDPFDGETFESNPVEFFLVCTDVHTGRACYHRCVKADRECFEWMRASGSMPLVSRPVSVGGGLYLDGAVSDAVPLKFFEERGYGRNVVILTRPAGYVKPPLRGAKLIRFLLRRSPALADALEKRHERYNRTIAYVEEQARRGRVFLFRPEFPLPAGRICHDPSLLEKTHEAGRRIALEKLDALREFLAGRE